MLALDEILGDSESDAPLLEIISRQLGKPPRSISGVAAYCSRNAPLVVITRPLIKKIKGVEPFPTIFWLSCPYLVKEVGRLESTGLIEEIEFLVSNVPILRENLYDAHREYVNARLALLTEEERNLLPREFPGIWRVLVSTGVGGVKDWNRVKCLHAHLAQFLATGKNPIGYIVSHLMGLDTMVCTSSACFPERRPAAVLEPGGARI